MPTWRGALILRGLLRWVFRVAIVGIALLALAIAVDSFGQPRSTLMIVRSLLGRPVDRQWVPLSAISPRLAAAVILSEDGQFCRHHGVDWGALRQVLMHGKGPPSRGASTLTMQVVKNLFLWPGRSYLRKAIEIPLALVVDALWGKKRVLEAYLNIAEWGDGVFGAEAAARRDFGESAAALSPEQAAFLATALPSPNRRDPRHPTRLHRLLATRIQRLASDPGSHTACLD